MAIIALAIILSLQLRLVMSNNCEDQVLESRCRQHANTYPDCNIVSCSPCAEVCDRLTPECVLLHAANWCINFPRLCPAALPTPPANAVAPNGYSQSIGASATYSCVIGYSGSPTCSCMANSATAGVWSAVSGNCLSTCFTSTLNI